MTEILRTSIQPEARDNFSHASFALYIPISVSAPRFVLILLPGFNGDGEHLLNEERWRSFVSAKGGVMLACTFKRKTMPAPHYAAAQHGSGAALELALDQLQEMSQEVSFNKIPFLIYGHSAGGQFAYGYSCYKPQQLIGFAAVKGGYYFPEPKKETFLVPGLMISGKKDLERRKKEIRILFESHRKKGAPWCWAEDAGGHDEADVLDFVVPYFEGILTRWSPGNRESPIAEKIDTKAGIWINLAEKSKLGTSRENNNDIRIGWLPTDTSYRAWRNLDVGSDKYTD